MRGSTATTRVDAAIRTVCDVASTLWDGAVESALVRQLGGSSLRAQAELLTCSMHAPVQPWTCMSRSARARLQSVAVLPSLLRDADWRSVHLHGAFVEPPTEQRIRLICCPQALAGESQSVPTYRVNRTLWDRVGTSSECGLRTTISVEDIRSRRTVQSTLLESALPEITQARLLRRIVSMIEFLHNGEELPVEARESTSWDMLPNRGYLSRKAQTMLRNQLAKFAGQRRWQVQIARRDSSRAVAWVTLSLPKGWAGADPFLVEEGETVWCFLEAYRPGRDKGRIWCTSWSNNATQADLRRARFMPALVLPVHCSYPAVLHDGKSWCMVPETSRLHEVRLYRSDVLAGPWIAAEALAVGERFVDATILEWQGIPTLFATTRGSASDTSTPSLLRSGNLSALMSAVGVPRLKPVLWSDQYGRAGGHDSTAPGMWISQSTCLGSYGHHLETQRIEDVTGGRAHQGRRLFEVGPHQIHHFSASEHWLARDVLA